MSEQSAVCCEGPGWVTEATDQVVSGGSSRPQLLHRIERQPLVLTADRGHRPLVLDPQWRLLHLLLSSPGAAHQGARHDGLRVERVARILDLLLVEDGGELPLLPGRLQRDFLRHSGRRLALCLDDESLEKRNVKQIIQDSRSDLLV